MWIIFCGMTRLHAVWLLVESRTTPTLRHRCAIETQKMRLWWNGVNCFCVKISKIKEICDFPPGKFCDTPKNNSHIWCHKNCLVQSATNPLFLEHIMSSKCCDIMSFSYFFIPQWRILHKKSQFFDTFCENLCVHANSQPGKNEGFV